MDNGVCCRQFGISSTTFTQCAPEATAFGEIMQKLEMWANAQPDGRPAEYRKKGLQDGGR